jgi:hypothetical protein
MSIPIIYVFSSTKGEYVSGEQRETELYTAAVTEDGTELFRTHGKLDPMVLTFRPEDHTLLHSACVTYAPGGYELQWRAPPEIAHDPSPALVEPVAAPEPVAEVASDPVVEEAVEPDAAPAAEPSSDPVDQPTADNVKGGK